MALPALSPPDAKLHIEAQREDPDGKGVTLAYQIDDARHDAECRYRAAGRPSRSEDLVAVTVDGAPLSSSRLYFLIRFWLSTSDARAADPSPLGDVASLPHLSRGGAYALQQTLNALPLTSVYALLAAAYSLVYGLVGRINLAFGEFASVGGYAATFGAGLVVSGAPAPMLFLALIFALYVSACFGLVASRLVFEPLHRASGQIVLVASVGLAIFLQEAMRLSQGPNLHWVSPIFNAPFGVARSGDFIVASAPNVLLAAAVMILTGAGLTVLMKWSRFGRDWRAYADDPLAAEMCGISPRGVFARTFALASALAGLAGYVMTMIYGAVGYGAATTLGLKALVATILGGIGSIAGAFLGGLLVGGFEALWSSAFPIDFRDIAVFSLLVALLTLRPGGILGARETGRISSSP